MAGVLLLRADARENIGAGHFMRALSLATEWIRQGGCARMLSAAPPGKLAEQAAAAGVSLQSSPYPAGSSEDLGMLLEHVVSVGVPSWVALDGYDFDYAYQSAVRSTGTRLLVVDDTAHQPRYSADLILNQNGGAEKLVYRANEDAVQLLGPHFALLRPEFRAVNGRRRSVRTEAHRLLVTFGGSDPENMTARVLRTLRQRGLTEFTVRVVVGAANPHGGELSAELVHWPPRNDGGRAGAEVLRDVTNMAEHMAWADLAIAAAGSTTWELAACGVPSLLVVTAENQARSAAAAEASGTAWNLGRWLDERAAQLLGDAVVALAADVEKRAAMSECGRALVDGRGGERVARTMSDLS